MPRGPLHGLEEDPIVNRDGNERGYSALGDENSFEGTNDDDAFVDCYGLDIFVAEAKQVCDDDDD